MKRHCADPTVDGNGATPAAWSMTGELLADVMASVNRAFMLLSLLTGIVIGGQGIFLTSGRSVQTEPGTCSLDTAPTDALAGTEP